MADERLVVMLEARVNEFEKRMRQAERTGTRSFDGMRRGAKSATRQMEADMARSAASMRQSIASISGGVGTMGKALAGGFLGGLAVGGLSEIAASSREVVQGLAEIGNEAKRAGLSAKAFQEWSYVAQANRISVDAVVDGFKELSLRTDEFIVTGAGPAAEAFTRLGLRADDLKKRLKDPSALMLEIMHRLEGMDKAAQIRIADEVFGGTGGERFVELLGQGQNALSDTIARAHEVGAVMDDELIAKAQELDQKFRDLQTTAGNFFRRVVVGGAEFVTEIADMRAKLDEVFASEAEGRAMVGDATYDALAGSRDLVDEQSQSIAELEGHYQRLAETAGQTAADLRGSIGTLDAWGYDEVADGLRQTQAEMDELVSSFRDGEISGEDFAAKLNDIQAEAAAAFAELDAGDRTSFNGVISQLTRLGGVIASVTNLAARLKATIASAAGTAPAQVATQAMRDRHAAEAASMESAKALTEANDKFTASETAHNAATRDQLSLQREMVEVRQRAKAAGAVLTEADVAGFAQAAVAGEAGRSASRGGGGGSKRKGSGGGGARSSGGGTARQSDFDRDAQQIRERIEAYNIEATVLAAAAASGQDYGDVMAYASEKAKLLAAAQQEGRAVTPALEAEIDGLARAYAQAGQSAEDAADRLKQVQEAGQRGAEAVSGIFTSALQGADAARQAVINLLQRLAEVQIQKAILGFAESGGGGGFFAGVGKMLSFDGGGYTGGGSRSGGLDGKGGFLALMHPKETVTDHTKSSSSSSAPRQTNINVNVTGARGNAEIEAMVQSGVAQGLKHYDQILPARVQQVNRNPRQRNVR